MKMKFYLYLSLILCYSCTMNEDKKKMLGDDYRLYKETAAWELAQAVQEEDTAKIQRIIVDEHIPVDFREPKYSQTLLMLAVRTNKELSVKKLLELGADPNAHGDSTKYLGENAVIIASRFTRPSNPYQANTVQMAILDSSTACGVAPIQKLHSLSSLLMKLVIKYLLLGFCKIVSIKSIACSNVS